MSVDLSGIKEEAIAKYSDNNFQSVRYTASGKLVWGNNQPVEDDAKDLVFRHRPELKDGSPSPPPLPPTSADETSDESGGESLIDKLKGKVMPDNSCASKSDLAKATKEIKDNTDGNFAELREYIEKTFGSAPPTPTSPPAPPPPPPAPPASPPSPPAPPASPPPPPAPTAADDPAVTGSGPSGFWDDENLNRLGKFIDKRSKKSSIKVLKKQGLTKEQLDQRFAEVKTTTSSESSIEPTIKGIMPIVACTFLAGMIVAFLASIILPHIKVNGKTLVMPYLPPQLPWFEKLIGSFVAGLIVGLFALILLSLFAAFTQVQIIRQKSSSNSSTTETT